MSIEEKYDEIRQLITLGNCTSMVGACGSDQRTQRIDVVGQYVADICHRIRHGPGRLTEDKPDCC